MLKGWQAISPSELLHIFKSASLPNGKFFIFTFDDGLRCQYINGLKILRKFSVGGLFFIPTCILDEKALFVHKLHFIRSKLDDETILELLYKSFSDIADVKLDEVILNRQYRYDSPQSAKLKYLLNFTLAKREARRDEFINTLLGDLIDYNVFFKQTYMSCDGIRELGELDYLGTHGHYHLPLAQLQYKSAYADIETSINILKEITGREICAISYPYGGPTAASKEVENICCNLGLKIGFSMQRGVNEDADIIKSPLMLKRIDVNDLDRFIHL
jgi:peptidoglycan/xylan/chitin deacetylase (PgdA/CDA1 family)